MEQVTELLHFQDTSTWEIPYILVLWLSIIVLVPFDLTTIDSGQQKNQEILVKRIMNIGRQYTEHSGKLRDGSAILLSKLITRPDVVKSGETDKFLNLPGDVLRGGVLQETAWWSGGQQPPMEKKHIS